jgi:hypothetical protein
MDPFEALFFCYTPTNQLEAGRRAAHLQSESRSCGALTVAYHLTCRSTSLLIILNIFRVGFHVVSTRVRVDDAPVE